jgi:L-fuculose-phosphate aldolase
LLSLKDQLIRYGTRAVTCGLASGAGGNISARDGNIIWIKPTGMPMDEITVDDLCGIDIRTGEQISGTSPPSSGLHLHMEIYNKRNDVHAVLHTHPPWACGVISTGQELKPLIVSFAADIGRIQTIPFAIPGTHVFGETVGKAAETAEAIFLVNGGVVTLGATIRQAFQRNIVVEDAAKAFVAALSVGRPRHFLHQDQIEDLKAVRSIQQRARIIKSQHSGENPKSGASSP